jgi:hypothetical protein
MYFSADVETDGPIPGPYSILSFALVYAGSFDGHRFQRPTSYEQVFYRELKPISSSFEPEALRVNRLDRERLCREGVSPQNAMTEASAWVKGIAGAKDAVLVAYPLCFDWTWLYWYFIRFSGRRRSPSVIQGALISKTAVSLKSAIPITEAGCQKVAPKLAQLEPIRTMPLMTP